jgi:glycosyltransferase involved in cell wall biosynthesis
MNSERAVEGPLVTVVIPTYNRGTLLMEAVGSVVGQSYRNWELIVVDDGSTDGSIAAVSKIADPRITIIESPHTGHIGQVRNVGVAAGKGELVAFLDSDDVWTSRKLEIQVPTLLESGCRWSYGGFELMDADGTKIPLRAGAYRAVSGWIADQVLTTEVGVSISTVLVKRSLFESVGRFSDDPRLRFRGDHELAIRLALAADAVAVPDTLVRIREHPHRATSTLVDPYERTALVYELFLALHPPKHLARIARGIRARHLADAAGQRIVRGHYGVAARLAGASLLSAVQPGYLAHAITRGIRDRRHSLRNFDFAPDPIEGPAH